MHRTERFLIRLAASILTFAWMTAAPATGQEGGGSPDEAVSSGEPAGTEGPTGPGGGDLLDTLREGAATATDAARTGEAGADRSAGAGEETPRNPEEGEAEPAAAEDEGSGDAAGTADTEGDDARRNATSIGTRLINWLESRTQGTLQSFLADVGVARERIRALGSIGEAELSTLASIVPGGLILLTSGIAFAYLTRLLVRPLLVRLGSVARDVGPLRKVLIGALGAFIDLLALLAAGVAAFVLASTIRPGDEPDALLRVSFIAAFFVAAALIASLRIFFSPATVHMRPLPMDDAAARACTRHAIIAVSALTFGEVVAATVIGELTRPEIGEAMVMLLNVAVLVYVASLVLLYRRVPEEFIRRRLASEPDNLLLIASSAIVPYWHVAALGYLGFLVHQSLTAGGHGIPVLVKSLQIAVALGVLVAVLDYLKKVAQSGVRFSDHVRGAFPMLEMRINAFVPLFMKLLRWTLVLIWTAFVLQTVGIFALWDWIEARFGIDILGTVTSLMLIGFVGFLAWLLVNGWIDYRLTPHHGHAPTPREQTLLALLRNASLIAILLFVLITSLAEIGVSIAPLLASAGVVGLAIGFGSQKLVQDIITGVFIQFENAINVGDVIEAGGKTGVVEKLTIRSVSLRDIQGVFHVIPFSSVDLVSNHMMGYGYHLADIGIAYREDIDAAKDEMLAAYDDMQADAIWSTKLLGAIEWFGVQELADSAVVLRARLKTRAGEQWAVGRAYSERVKKRFDAAGIEIPFPHVTLWFGEQKEGNAPPAHLSFASTGLPLGDPDDLHAGKTTRQTVRKPGLTDASEDGGDEDADQET